MDALKRHYGGEAFKVEKEAPFPHPNRLHSLPEDTRRKRLQGSKRPVRRRFHAAGDTRPRPREHLSRLIRPSGYFNQKATYIIGACRAIVERFGGETPRTRDELLTLPGVGPKTADIVLSYGYGEPAIAVDTHIHRVSRRLGLASEEAKPTEVKEALQGALPREDWIYADGALLQLGKDYCKPKKPRCGQCPLKELCDYKKGV